ncbi:hypothetical protein WJX82_003070 [Trebouxia sp. C0006]
MNGLALQPCRVHAGSHQTALKPAAGINSQSPLVHTRYLPSRTAAPVADQAPSPDGSAVLENSEQFQVHLKAAIMDPRVKEQNEVTPEVKTLVEELKSIAPKDRKKITKEGIKGVFNGVLSDFGDRMSSDGMSTLGTISFQQFKPTDLKIKAEGTQVLISTEYENQYSVNIPFVIQDGPLAGVKGVQTTIGEYTIDDSEPVRQKIGFTALSLGPNTSDSSAKQKWMEVMKKANAKMDEEGKILLSFPEPMKGFRDFLYFDEQLQMSIGNRGSLTIIQQET